MTVVVEITSCVVDLEVSRVLLQLSTIYGHTPIRVLLNITCLLQSLKFQSQGIC